MEDISDKKVVLCGGGTGGHIFPSIAVGEILKSKGCDLYYIGVEGKPEEAIAEKNDIAFYGYKFYGLPRKISKDLITWPLSLLKAISKAKLYLKHFKPDIVFGTGGYSAAPVFIAAKSLKIPYIVHNLDVRIGLANKFSAGSARLLTLGFDPLTGNELNNSYIVTGNPIRKTFKEILNTDKVSIYKKHGLDPNKKTIFVIGGSQGAHSINEAFIDISKELVLDNNIQVVHQTGEAKHEVFAKRIPAKVLESGAYIAKSFIDSPEEFYYLADLVISRAGAMTTTEIMLMGTPTIFIPYPFAGNHQEANAQNLITKGGAVLIRQSDLEINPKLLTTKVLSLINDEEKLKEMKEITKTFAKPNASEDIANLVLENAKSKYRRSTKKREHTVF